MKIHITKGDLVRIVAVEVRWNNQRKEETLGFFLALGDIEEPSYSGWHGRCLGLDLSSNEKRYIGIQNDTQDIRYDTEIRVSSPLLGVVWCYSKAGARVIDTL